MDFDKHARIGILNRAKKRYGLDAFEPSSVFLFALCSFAGRKSNSPLLFVRWRFDQVLNRLKHSLDLLPLFFLLPAQLIQLPRQILMRGEDLPQPHERAHNGDIDLNRTCTGEDAGEHGDSLLREHIGPVAATAAALV